ncbi:MAG TPA: glycosyltransferase family 4 protein [Vicinamibacterales bacterium]
MTESPLAILLVGDYPDDPRLGSSKVFYKLREELQALGHTCDIVWTDGIGEQPASRQVRQLVSPWMAWRAIIRQTARRRYDVVDVASAEGLFLGLRGLIGRRDRAAFVCRSNGLEQLNYARMVDDHHEGLRSKSWMRRIWYPASRLSQVAGAARLADGLLVLNDGDRAFAVTRKWQPPDRVTVVPHGISARFLTEAPPPASPRGAGLLFCGTWDHVKGITYLCAAIDRLHATGNRVRLTVLGPGMPPETVLGCFAPAVRAFVTVIDRVPEERVMEEYRRHDALLFTSTYEGFGLVVIEAMSQRLPVIATPIGCAATLVREGETGYRVPPRDPEALASAIVRLTANPLDAGRLGNRGRDAVSGMTWRSSAEQTLAVYRRAIARVRQ